MPILGKKSLLEVKLAGSGQVVAKQAPDFTLPDQEGQPVTLSKKLSEGHILLVFYPGDFTMVCTEQLCNYRDSTQDFSESGLSIIGVSSNSSESHRKFAETYHFDFPLLTDSSNIIANAYGCQSVWMFGKSSRAVFIINRKGLILYRYVEPTILTRRKAAELIAIVNDLKNHRLL